MHQNSVRNEKRRRDVFFFLSLKLNDYHWLDIFTGALLMSIIHSLSENVFKEHCTHQRLRPPTTTVEHNTSNGFHH